jgi:MoxR-like ATPase
VIYSDQATGEKQFKFLPGPLFANILLADEINRTPPKTQAAMLEAMQERRVTVGGNTYALPKPFFVLATQNPLEQEGTYPLPEAQLDRFLFLINVDYPTTEDELQIMRLGTGQAPEPVQPVLSIDQILFIQQTVKLISISEHVYRYAQRIVASTRPKQPEAFDFCKKFLSFGAGPRASLGLIIAAQAHALIHGQIYLSCANVAAVTPAVMRHRIAVNFTAQSEGITSTDIVRMILEKIPQDEPLN